MEEIVCDSPRWVGAGQLNANICVPGDQRIAIGLPAGKFYQNRTLIGEGFVALDADVGVLDDFGVLKQGHCKACL